MQRLDDSCFLWILIGDKDDAKNLQQLLANRIKYILNVTPLRVDGGVPNYHERNPHFYFCRIPILDNNVENLSAHYETAWAFFEQARIREDGNLLVHCHMGVSRSVAVVCSYLIKYYRFTLNDALSLIRRSRKIARPNDNFLLQLKELEEELRKTGNYATPANAKSTNRQEMNSSRRQPIGPMRQNFYSESAETNVAPQSAPIGPFLPTTMCSKTSADNSI